MFFFSPIVLRLTSYFPKSTTAPAILTPLNSSSLSAIASSSTSIALDSTGGLSTGSLIGIIGGCVGAVAVTGLVVAFFLRRQKKREGFDPITFRRSAIMLNDKDERAGLRPRPPTMIERRKAHATPVKAVNLPTPSMAFPYSDQTPATPLHEHGHPQSFAHSGASDTQLYSTVPPPVPSSGYSGIPGAYSILPLDPYNGTQSKQAGYGAPPIPGTYGPSAYAAYGPDPRYPQYQHQHQDSSPHHQTPRYSQPQQMFGHVNPNAQPPSVSVKLSNPSTNSPNALLNVSHPQSPLLLTEKQRLHLATTVVDASSSSSPPSLTQWSGPPPAYVDEDDSQWDISRNNIKSRRKEMNVVNEVDKQAAESSSGSATSTPASESTSPPVPEATLNAPSQESKSTGLRPTSEYTLYDQDDVYGGM